MYSFDERGTQCEVISREIMHGLCSVHESTQRSIGSALLLCSILCEQPCVQTKSTLAIPFDRRLLAGVTALSTIKKGRLVCDRSSQFVSGQLRLVRRNYH